MLGSSLATHFHSIVRYMKANTINGTMGSLALTFSTFQAYRQTSAPKETF